MYIPTFLFYKIRQCAVTPMHGQPCSIDVLTFYIGNSATETGPSHINTKFSSPNPAIITSKNVYVPHPELPGYVVVSIANYLHALSCGKPEDIVYWMGLKEKDCICVPVASGEWCLNEKQVEVETKLSLEPYDVLIASSKNKLPLKIMSTAYAENQFSVQDTNGSRAYISFDALIRQGYRKAFVPEMILFENVHQLETAPFQGKIKPTKYEEYFKSMKEPYLERELLQLSKSTERKVFSQDSRDGALLQTFFSVVNKESHLLLLAEPDVKKVPPKTMRVASKNAERAAYNQFGGESRFWLHTSCLLELQAYSNILFFEAFKNAEVKGNFSKVPSQFPTVWGIVKGQQVPSAIQIKFDATTKGYSFEVIDSSGTVRLAHKSALVKTIPALEAQLIQFFTVNFEYLRVNLYSINNTYVIVKC